MQTSDTALTTMFYELQDLAFFICSLKQPSESFNILDYVKFHHPKKTRSSTFNKLKLSTTISSSKFNRLVHLWNSLPPIDLDQSYNTIHKHIKSLFYDHFNITFDQSDYCTFHALPLSMHQMLKLSLIQIMTHSFHFTHLFTLADQK